MGNAVAYRHSVAKQQTRKKMENCRKQRERTGGISFNQNIHGNDGRRHQISESHAGTSADSYVRISIGGKSYCVRTELFTPDETRMHRFVGSSHEDRLKMCDGFDQTTTEYYFERNSKLADHLIDYYSTGSLHRPTNVCAERFREELEFWEISLDQLSSCCTILAGTEATTATKKTKGFPQVADDFEPIFDGVCLGSFRLTLWRFLEDPQSSIPAAVFALFSVIFVFASVFGLILGSMPEFQEDNSMAEAYHNMHNRKVHPSDVGSHKFSSQTLDQNPVFPNFVYKPTDNPSVYLVILEYVCIGWFTFEYIVRVIVYPRRLDFAKKTLNLIDLLTILPFYLELCLPLFGVYASKFKDFTGDEMTLTRGAQTWMGAMLVIRVLRVLRMARVFKLARYSTSLQTFGHTLQSSITELSMLSMFLLTGIVFFSTIMYYLERDEPNTDFYSIPAGCWWCVVTMATVGYGDAKPVTTMGKLVATTTSICGIIVLAFPISMIVEKFASAQQKAIEETQLAQAQLSAAANNALLRRFPTRRKQRMRAIVESHDKLLSTVT